MRKIVLKKTWTNILLYSILGGVILGIMLFPISSYLRDVGLSMRDSTLIAFLISYPTAVILLNLAVKIEPTKPTFPKGLVVFLTVLGFLVIYVGVAMREIFFACIGALLIIVVCVWGIQEHRKTTKKEIVL